MFAQDTTLLHPESNRKCVVLMTPEVLKIKTGDTWTPGYMYSCEGSSDIYVRPQMEMEDGRFVQVAAL